MADFVTRRDRSKGSHSVSQISPRRCRRSRGCTTRVSRSIKKHRVGENWTESVREDKKKKRKKKERRIEEKMAAVKNNEDVFESDTGHE